MSGITLGHICACGQPIVYFEADDASGTPTPVPGLMWLLNPTTGTADILVLEPETEEMVVRRKIPECDWRSPQPGRWCWPASTDVERLFDPAAPQVAQGPDDIED